MSPCATGCEAKPMTEPAIALAVALILGVYLVITLIRPERF
jgi:K+-transporting ATPase KdpF subunit